MSFPARLCIFFFIIRTVSSMCTIFCFAITVVGTMALFSFFTTWEGCTANKIFIGVNAALCLLLSVISALICCGPSMMSWPFPYSIFSSLTHRQFPLGYRRRNSLSRAPSEYNLSVYYLLDMDGRFVSTEGTGSVAPRVGSSTQRPDGITLTKSLYVQ